MPVKLRRSPTPSSSPESLRTVKSSSRSSPSSSSKKKSETSTDAAALSSALISRQNTIVGLLILLVLLSLILIGTSVGFILFWYRSGSGNENGAALSNKVEKLSTEDPRPVVWITGPDLGVGYLNNVMEVFDRVGYRIWVNRTPPPDGWNILWSHEYPFTKNFNLPDLKPYQKVNHFPGSGFITNKVNLATSGLKHIPKAFNIPNDREKFLKFASENPDKLWVQKDNNHRGIRVKSIQELNLEKSGTFVQEFIHNPLLIDGKKFDIGLYVTLTSINPMRVYVFDNDVLLRFCAKPYFPFNVSDEDSYVVGDKYTATWDIPSLRTHFVDLNMNMKAALDSYIRKTLKKDPATVWTQIEESIKTIYYMKEEQIYRIAGMYPDLRNFFEMVRFDFTLDTDLNVYLMEANMSPNLASSKYPANKLLYDQVLFSLYSLVGVVQPSRPMLQKWPDMPSDLWNMVLLDKDLAILPDVCSDERCLIGSGLSANESAAICSLEQCDICYRCLSGEFKLKLKDAYVEEFRRWHNKRLIPSTSIESPITLGTNNYLQDKWFIGKCLTDSRWCN